MKTMRAMIALACLVSTAQADDAAQRDLLVEYKRIARDAALGGNCEAARELAERVRVLDPAYFAAEVATDPTIAPCLPPPSSPAAVAPVDGAVPIAPPASVAPRVIDREPAPPALVPYDRPAVPPLDGGRIIGEILLGGLSAGLGILGGGLIGVAVCADDGGEFSCLGSAIVGAYFGGAAMFGLGVYAAGQAGDQTGSLGAAMLGGMLGAGVGLGALFALEESSEVLLATFLIGGPVAGALIGFNGTRRWKSAKPAVGSLFRFDRDGVSLGIPIVIHGEQRGAASTSLTLFSGAF
jgi:hypothetical protein